jgi:hypothetical protein
MVTKYPADIDDLNTLPKVTDLISPIVADDHNVLRDAIVAIETELGTAPSGIYGTLKDRLDELKASEVALIDSDGYYDSSTVEGALREIFEITLTLTGSSGVIGAAEDGDYTDGLFVDFAFATPVGTAVDRFNEVLKSLSPAPAPALSDMSFTSTSGPEGKVSFGASNAISGYTNVGTAAGGAALDINGTFTTGGSREGVFNNSTTQSGVIADAIAADTGSPTPAYPANAFGDADQGLLQLFVNGSKIHETDLSVFSSGTDTTSGTGFVLTAAADGYFPNGDIFTIFKNRTGTWQVDPTHQRNGWNYCQVLHVVGATTNSTNFFEWVVDANVTATTFGGLTLDTLAMTGSSSISGVEYHTGGTAAYDITVSNLHRNTYSSSASAISHSTTTNCTVASAALGTISAESDTEVITNKVVTVSPDSSSRIINASIVVDTTVDRTVQSDLTSSTSAIANLLVDSNSDSSTNTNEPMNGEQFRVATNKALTDITGYNSGGNGALWDETQDLISGSAGHTDGLLMYNGVIVYPTNTSGVTTGNFSSATNGPAGNPNYTAAAGTRYFWRYFYDSSTRQNFSLNVTNTGTTFVTVGAGLTSTNVYLEILAPNTTQNGSAVVEFKDARTAYTTDNAIGCLNGAFSESSWPITLGGRSTATSGNSIVVRVTASAAWTGDISRIQLTWA